MDVCGADYPEARAALRRRLPPPQLRENRRVRLEVDDRRGDARADRLPASGAPPTGPSARSTTCTACASTGHPDLTRILLWEGFNGYPLRKDFPVEGIDTGSAIYPEYYEESAGPVAGTGTGWKPAKPPQRSRPIEHDRAAHADLPLSSPDARPPSSTGEEMELNFGPQHPSTHGVLRLKLKVDGERIVDAYPIIGYLHRGTEKLFELHPFFQNVPHTDRMDYVAAATNNLAYVGAVEKLLGRRGAAARALHPHDPRRAAAHLLAPAVARDARASTSAP